MQDFGISVLLWSVCISSSIVSHSRAEKEQTGVRDNIESFGGDPNRGTPHRDANRLYLVTVIGQSVGASDIDLQLTAFGGDKDVPFQQAV
jgi:hypothetical protein